MVGHEACPRRENREIGPAFSLDLELSVLPGLTQLIVGDVERICGRGLHGTAQALDLSFPPSLELTRRGSVVPVTIKNHRNLLRRIARLDRVTIRRFAALHHRSSAHCFSLLALATASCHLTISFV